MIINGKSKLEDFKLKHPDACSHVDSWFAEAKEIGITAGASTPKELIESTVERIRELTT